MSNPLVSALLAYYNDIGVHTLSTDKPLSKIYSAPGQDNAATLTQETTSKVPLTSTPETKAKAKATSPSPSVIGNNAKNIEGSADLYKKAEELAQNAQNLEELRQAIAGFDGISFKNMCTNMVFSDGNPNSPIMVIGEAPGADEDKEGKPFVGKAGQLLNRMFAAIGLDRTAEDPAKSFYISNILNWRPPGNRTPTEQETSISLPFIERHISLINPQIIVLMGAVSGKALLNKTEGISKFRGKWHDYRIQTPKLQEYNSDTPIKALATFHPAYLLRQAEKKKESWADLLEIKKQLDKSA